MANYWIQHNPDGLSHEVDNEDYHSDEVHAGLPCEEGVIHMTRTIHGIKHGYAVPFGDSRLDKVYRAVIEVLRIDTKGNMMYKTTITTSFCKYRKDKVCQFGDRRYIMLRVLRKYPASEVPEVPAGFGNSMSCMI